MAGPLGAAPGIMLGVGIGGAASAAFEPELEPARQSAWKRFPNRVLDPATLAALVAQGAVELDVGRENALRHGFDVDKFQQLVYLAQRAPTHAEAQDLRRRGKITAEQLRHSFAKDHIEQQFWQALEDLVDDRLSAEVVAGAIVRGLMVDPGILPVGPPTTVGKVPAFPVSKLDPVDEAASSGVNVERLAVLAGMYGRPLAPDAAAAALFKGILERADFDRAIAEGDFRNEWADALLANARQIPSVSDYVNAHLRGWITEQQMIDGADRHGMSAADVKLLYLRSGRPAAPGQMATAWVRGIDGPEGRPMDLEQFLKGIAQSDVRPEWGPMLAGIRWKYPPLFQLSRLVDAGAVPPATAVEWAGLEGYHPDVVAALEKFWTQPKAGSAASTRERLATTQAVAALKRRFLVDRIDDAGVTAGLEKVGETPAAAGRILATWKLERDWTERPLTPSQIKRAWRAGELDDAQALAALVEQHLDPADAELFLKS